MIVATKLSFESLATYLIIVDLSDPDLSQTVGDYEFVAVASDGHAYLLQEDANGSVTGLVSTDPFAVSSIQVGDTWTQADGRDYRAIGISPGGTSPSGHSQLTYVLEVTADESGTIAASERPRVYFDERGFAEESVNRLEGEYVSVRELRHRAR